MTLNFGNQLFPPRKENIVASFDFSDIAEGTGGEKYSFLTLRNTSGTLYKIIPINIITDMISTVTTTTGTEINNRIGNPAFVKNIDLDFDLSVFNLPRTIRGNFYGKLKWGAIADSGGGGSNDQGRAYTIIKIRKWDGTSETEIASYQSETKTILDTKTFIEMLEINIQKTSFKTGENLRVTIEIWVALTDADHVDDSIKGTLEHDPNTNDNEIFAWVPYHLEI